MSVPVQGKPAGRPTLAALRAMRGKILAVPSRRGLDDIRVFGCDGLDWHREDSMIWRALRGDSVARLAAVERAQGRLNVYSCRPLRSS